MNLTIPQQWATSLLVLLYKGKGATCDPNAYRGISLLCAPYKLFTKIVKQRIEEKIEPKLSNWQFGFRKQRSTADAISAVLGRAKTAIDSKTRLFSLFVDYQKAFDSVDRSLLLRKLKERF